MTTYLSLEDLIALTGDPRLGAVRDIDLLDAAAHRPQSVLYGQSAYPDLDTRAAVLLDSVVRNHALVDGKKSLAGSQLSCSTGSPTSRSTLRTTMPMSSSWRWRAARPRSRTSQWRCARGTEAVTRIGPWLCASPDVQWAPGLPVDTLSPSP